METIPSHVNLLKSATLWIGNHLKYAHKKSRCRCGIWIFLCRNDSHHLQYEVAVGFDLEVGEVGLFHGDPFPEKTLVEVGRALEDAVVLDFRGDGEEDF